PLPGIPTPPNNFEIKRLIGSMQPFSRSITATGREVVKADTGQLRSKQDAYKREITYNERKFIPIMDLVIERYLKMEEAKQKEASTINTGKFISLGVAFILLVILVLEPAFKKGQQNYDQLQKARNELLKEKKYLASILDSQTNYVIRIDKTGN